MYVYIKRHHTAVEQWLRCCSTNRKVVGSIQAGVIGIFLWHKILPIALWPWGRLSLQQKWVPGAFPGVKVAGALGWQPYHHPVPLSWNLGTLTSWNPLGHSRPVTGLLNIYIYIYICSKSSSSNLCTSFSKFLVFFLKSVIMFCFKNMGGVCCLDIVHCTVLSISHSEIPSAWST